MRRPSPVQRICLSRRRLQRVAGCVMGGICRGGSGASGTNTGMWLTSLFERTELRIVRCSQMLRSRKCIAAHCDPGSTRSIRRLFGCRSFLSLQYIREYNVCVETPTSTPETALYCAPASIKCVECWSWQYSCRFWPKCRDNIELMLSTIVRDTRSRQGRRRFCRLLRLGIVVHNCALVIK